MNGWKLKLDSAQRDWIISTLEAMASLIPMSEELRLRYERVLRLLGKPVAHGIRPQPREPNVEPPSSGPAGERR